MNVPDTTKPEAIQIELTVTKWGSVLAQLQAASDLADHQLEDAAAKGALWRKKPGVNKIQRIRHIETQAGPSDQLYLNYDAKVLGTVALQPSLVSDEVNYSVWDKPAGMLSQGSKWSDHCTITQTVQHVHGKPTHLVHRLDKAASGLIVVAHTKNALKQLTVLFADRLVEKHYQVCVHGKFAEALPYRLDADIEGRSALSHILSAQFDTTTNTTSLEVSISTGRKHQIRSHLSGHGFNVVGDRLFDREREHDQDLALRASRLAFDCPFTNKQKVFNLT